MGLGGFGGFLKTFLQQQKQQQQSCCPRAPRSLQHIGYTPLRGNSKLVPAAQPHTPEPALLTLGHHITWRHRLRRTLLTPHWLPSRRKGRQKLQRAVRGLSMGSQRADRAVQGLTKGCQRAVKGLSELSKGCQRAIRGLSNGCQRAIKGFKGLPKSCQCAVEGLSNLSKGCQGVVKGLSELSLGYQRALKGLSKGCQSAPGTPRDPQERGTSTHKISVPSARDHQ